MAIPFKSLRYQPGTDQTWGINLRRVVRWKNEWSYLAQVPRALTTFRGILKVSSAGTLEGLQVPSGSSNLELKPYALGGRRDRSHRHAALSTTTRRPRSAAISKYGITQNITADLTVNTDFAQVEVDEQQVNLTRFNLFFPGEARLLPRRARDVRVRRTRQRRPRRGHAATRRICSSAAASVWIGRESMPLVPAAARPARPASSRSARSTSRPTTMRPSKIESANFTVLRAKRDILRRSSIGGMFTHRTATPGRVGANEGYGVDSTLSFYQNVRIDALHRRRRRPKAATATT